MAVRAETKSGVTIPDEQREFGQRIHGVIDRVASNIVSLPSFRLATAKAFFDRPDALKNTKGGLRSVTFVEGNSPYSVGWSIAKIESHGFSPDVSLIGSHLTLKMFDYGDGSTDQWQAIASMSSHFLENADGDLLEFTGGDIKLESGFVIGDLRKGRPSWKFEMPTTSLHGVGAIKKLPEIFGDICPVL